MRPRLLATLALALALVGCRKNEPSAQGQSASTPTAEAEPTDLPKSDLPPSRPADTSIVYQAEHGTGDLAYLWLTPKTSTYSRRRGSLRVELHYDAPAGELDRIYTILRNNAFDKIETVPSRGAPRPGTMLELTMGKRRYAVLDKANLYPKARWAEAYDACARAVQASFPTPDPERAWVELRIEFDPSLSDAQVEASLGPDFVGLRWLEDQRDEPVVLVARVRTVEVAAEQRPGPPPGPGAPEVPPPGPAKTEVDLARHLGVRVFAADGKIALEPIVGKAVVHGNLPPKPTPPDDQGS